MNIKVKIIKIAILTFVLCVLYVSVKYLKNYSNEKDLVGLYRFNGTATTLCGFPCLYDKLILYKNGYFESDFYGNGTYEIKSSWRKTELHFKYNYEFGVAGFELLVKKYLVKSNRLYMSIDNNAYYKELDIDRNITYPCYDKNKKYIDGSISNKFVCDTLYDSLFNTIIEYNSSKNTDEFSTSNY